MSDWWDGGVLYQVYPRSFADSNRDGVGDLRGITAHLEHLAWLGVDGLWLSPVHPSPNADWGYDVADYYGVHPDLGTLDDLDTLIATANRLSIRVLLDLVPNHTSTEHPWFVDARADRSAGHRDWYVWADPTPDGGPPNNWVSSFFGPAWSLDDRTGQYFLHSFLVDQADLNWWDDEVRDEFDRILTFWFDRGVAGFRIDVCHMMVKDRRLRDNPPATDADSFMDQLRGQRPEYNSCRPEVHDVLRRWRSLGSGYDPARVLVGETYVFDLDQLASFYGHDDELQLAFNFPFLLGDFDAGVLRDVVERTEATLPADAIPVWTMGNHDVSRYPTRWAAGDPRRARAALVLLFGLRGTTVLYYGDELATPDTDVPTDRLVDPVSIQYHPVANRDAARTPMRWTAEPGAGFTAAGVDPWLPFGDTPGATVAEQRADPDSALHLTRGLIALRRALPALRTARYETWPAPGGVWAWRRGDDLLVAVNFGDAATGLDGIDGTIQISTDRSRDGDTVAGRLTLAPFEAAIVSLG
ncbi:MAG TPA: alpha-amylase family glycosyl hydrolase [Acidimicrobiia bacterium]|nr:alpha-amylase family glycosyl hydrolase [Acidimicrobiia bacterium]